MKIIEFPGQPENFDSMDEYWQTRWAFEANDDMRIEACE